MQNPGFLTMAVKLVVNVHDMNNEGSIGSTTDIRMVRMVGEDGKELPGEVPAVSGRMLKHWHLAYMLKEELNQPQQKLCDKCREWKPDRQSAASDEITGVSECLICDTHGFLSTAKVQAPPRRSSCISFSWLLPVIGTDSPSKQVIHSRVEPSGSIPEETPEPEASGDESLADEAAEEVKRKTSQMIFYKNYASSIYAFVCSIDLDRIGKPLTGNINFNDNGAEVKRRRRMAVKALFPIIVGAFGASQSHALPHAKCLGVLAALSDNTTPLPNLVSPIYSNGFEESIKMLKGFKNDVVKYWGFGEPVVEQKQDNIQAFFKSILDELN